MLREVAGEEEADRLGGALAGAPEYAVQLSAHRAALHPAELEELQRVLDAQGTKLPRDLFDSSHAELLRYAATHGMLEVCRSYMLVGRQFPKLGHLLCRYLSSAALTPRCPGHQCTSKQPHLTSISACSRIARSREL